MSELNDTTLMAYVDGELPADEAAEVRQRAQTDAGVRARIEAFAASRRILRKTFDASLDRPLPDALLAKLNPPSAPRRRSPWARHGRWAVAASVVAAVAVGVMVGVRPTPPGAPLLAMQQIGQTLERLPSGEPDVHATASGVSVEVLPLATLRTAEGVFCRDYEISAVAADAVSERGRACRDAEGRWQPASRHVAAGDDPTGFQTASGEGRDAGVDRYSQSEEAALIEAGWPQP